MTSKINEAIEKCAHESHAGLLTFPEVLEQLVDVGVESYFADYRKKSSTYYLSKNEAIQIPLEMPPLQISNPFNKDGILLAIRAAQSDTIRYPEFLKLTMSAGCVGYIVWITGRHVSYFGRKGEVHVEHFPS